MQLEHSKNGVETKKRVALLNPVTVMITILGSQARE